MLRRLAGVALAFLASLLPLPAWAGLPAQAEALRVFLTDPDLPETVFAPSFLSDIPPERVRALADGLAREFGKPLAIRSLQHRSAHVSAFDVEYERAFVAMVMTVSGDGPRPVIGWMVTGHRFKNDSFERVSGEIEALPGKAAILLTRLDAAEEPRLAYRSNESLAIGSAFKLWVLAEAAAQVKAGKRRWSDVIPLGSAALPSGITQDWPAHAPLTLHSLATLMISISDNTATDTLVSALGRERVLAQADGGNQDYPVLLTREAFALKMPAQTGLLKQYRAAAAKDRARLLDKAGAVLVKDAVDPAHLTMPRAVDSAEWFAAPLNLLHTLNRIRLMGSREALDILAIAPGLPPGEAGRFAWVGYKGGSETGVVSQNWLVRLKDGRWYGLSAIWNNPAAAVDKDRFSVIVRRALTLLETK